MTLKKSNIVVVYRSKSGFTKNYAKWLAEELNCDLISGKKTKVNDLLKYDTIIYGGGLYASGMNGIKLITNNFDILQDKKLIVFAVGATPSRTETIKEIRNVNIPIEQQEKIRFFYLRGGFDYNKLTPLNKLLMNMLKAKLKNTKNPDADERGMLAGYTHPLDFTKKENIKEILEYIKQ